jgi:hypothetical protein
LFLIGAMPLSRNQRGIANFLQTAEFFDLGLDDDRHPPGLLEAVTLDVRIRQRERRSTRPARPSSSRTL